MKITKKIDNEVLQGIVVYNILSYPERIEYSKNSAVQIISENDTQQAVVSSSLDRALEYYNLAKKQLVNVDVKIVSGEYEGTIIDSIESLSVYEEGQEVIMELATQLIAGVSLGKKKQQD